MIRVMKFVRNNHVYFIKRRFSLFLIIASSIWSPYQIKAQASFSYQIYTPGNLDKEVTASVVDMAYWLQQATRKKYNIKSFGNGNEAGIHLIEASQSALSSQQKNQLNRDGQSFYLVIADNSKALIIGTGTNSFINGIYTFLYELGFRWYMPGEVWTIIPSALPKNLKINKLYAPDFQSRFYAGTGGVNAIAETDPQNNFRADYNTWNRRNRFSVDYAVKGHTGQLFYSANKKILDANPSWFCNGKVHSYGRIDISNSSVVKVFTNWALGQVKPGQNFPTIGVDPSDGSGGKDDCLPANMPGIKSWSDKYFWLANRVASQLHKNDFKTQVQLYAYSDHAAPPSFALEKNVYPIIIPYAFQRITSPDNFIKIWSSKIGGRAMGMYDYWNITQWSIGVPQLNIYSIPEKLRLWKKYNITSINIETTNGKGAMGHALWLTSQMMWNTRLSFDSLYRDFLATCFGPAASDVKRMYDRWSRNYQEQMEVNLSLHDLEAASAKTKDRAILDRLSELKAYVHYLKLYYEFLANQSSTEAFDKVTNYIHAIHGLRLVQTSALLERYIKAPKNYKAVSNKNRASRIISITTIENQFKQDIKEYTANYSISDAEFDIKKAKPIADEKQSNPRYLNGRNDYRFFLPSAEEFKIEVGSTEETKLLISDGDKSLVEKMIPASKDGYTTIKLKLPGGSYTLSFGDFARFSRIIFPSNKVFISSGIAYYDNAGFPLHYVYVPKDVDAIVYQDNLGPGVNKRGFWVDPGGQKVEAQKLQGKVYKVNVPSQYRGKVWTLNIGHRSFKMLNIPNIFSIRKFEYKEN